MRRLVLSTTLGLGLLVLSACGNKTESLPATQVAAKVGSEEISMHQVNAVLARGSGRGATPEQVQALSRTALEGLIDQQVAVEQAIESNLHRDPQVIAQIEAARRAVLASAYVRQFVASVPQPDEQDAKKYFAEHPALFGERRVYTVQEIVVARSAEVLAQLNSMAAANQSLEAVAAWLKARQIGFRPASVSRAAEQIPLDLLPRMHALKDGQAMVFSTPTTVTILRLVASRTQPVTEAAALPRITQYLGTQRTVDAVGEHIKALRGKASVVYLGEFSAPPPDAAAAAAPAPVASGAAGDPVPGPLSSTLEKGVAGLK